MKKLLIVLSVLLALFINGCGPKLIKERIVPVYTGTEISLGPYVNCYNSTELIWIEMPYGKKLPYYNAPYAIQIHPSYIDNTSLAINIKIKNIPKKSFIIKKQSIRLTDLDGNIIKSIIVPYTKTLKSYHDIKLHIGKIPINGAKLQLPIITINHENVKKEWQPSGVIILKPVSSSINICS